MKGKSKLMFLVTILIAITIISAVFYISREYLGDRLDQAFGRITPPKATGNISDLEDALLKELSDMELLFTEEEADLDIIMSDETEINDFGQSIDESEL